MICTQDEKELLITLDKKLSNLSEEMRSQYLHFKKLFDVQTEVKFASDYEIEAEISCYIKDYDDEIFSFTINSFNFTQDDEHIELVCDGKISFFKCSMLLYHIAYHSQNIDEILSIQSIFWEFRPRLQFSKDIGSTLSKKLIWLPIVGSDDYRFYLPDGVREKFSQNGEFYMQLIRALDISLDEKNGDEWLNDHSLTHLKQDKFITKFRQIHIKNLINLNDFHSDKYLNKLMSDHSFCEYVTGLIIPKYVPLILIKERVLNAYKSMCEGTLYACKLALEQGFAVNSHGGFGHSKKDDGGLKAPYNDIALSVKNLHKDDPGLKILYASFGSKKSVGVFEFAKDEKNFWACEITPKDKSDGCKTEIGLKNVAYRKILPNTTALTYLQSVKNTLSKAISEIKPDLIIYSSDLDMVCDEFEVSFELLRERDAIVSSLAFQSHTPLCICLSGDKKRYRYTEIKPFYEGLISDMLRAVKI